MNNRKSVFNRNVVFLAEGDDDSCYPPDCLFKFVEEGKGDCIVNIDGYLIVPLEKVLGDNHARKCNPGFFEKLLISLGIYVIDSNTYLSSYERLKRFFRYWLNL